MTEDGWAQDGEHVVGVARIAQTDAVSADSGEGLHREDHQGVDAEQEERRDDARLARGYLGVVRLLVEVERRVPAPVDEEHVRQANGELIQMLYFEGMEPRERRREMTDRGTAVTDPYQSPHRQDGEHGQFNSEQGLLKVGGNLNADVADPRHGDDPGNTDQKHPRARRVVANAGRVEHIEYVLPGDLSEAGHHDNVRDNNSPAAHPANSRAEGSRRPGERGAAVGVGSVHLLEGNRDEEHRHEG